MSHIQIEIPDKDHPRVKAAAALSGQTLAEFCAMAAVTVANYELAQAAKPSPEQKSKDK